jgi:RNA-directed DNA polymerase
METWSTHQLYNKALAVHDSVTAMAIRRYAQNLINKGTAVVFSLEHLSRITHVSYIRCLGQLLSADVSLPITECLP